MADALGVAEQGTQQDTTTDYLGQKVPVSFRGQPALPSSAAPAGAGGAPATSATGTVPAGTKTPLESGPLSQTTFLDLAGATGGDAASEGPGAPGVGQNTDAAGGPALVGLSQNIGPATFSLAPTGTIGVGVNTGNKSLDAAINAVGKTAAAAFGVPASVNVPSLLAGLISSPAMGMVAQAFGAFGVPMTIANLAHAIASLSPTSVTSLQAALANPNPELALTQAQALALAQGGQRGPTVGGPQSPTGLATDNPAMGPQGAAFGLSATNPSIASQNQNLTNMTLADIANAIFGGPRANDPIDTTGGPSGPGPSGTASSPGESSPAGLGEGGPAGPGVSESGASVGTGNAAGVGGTGDAGTGAGDTGDGPGGAAGDY